MPNRILRDWTDSEKVNALTAEQERLFVRLIMVADDHGCFYGDPRRIRAACFPFREEVTAEDCRSWLNALIPSLVRQYTHDNKPYIEIIEFGQRLRQMRRKFPAPSESTAESRILEENPEENPERKCQSIDGHWTVNGRSDDCQLTVMLLSIYKRNTESRLSYMEESVLAEIQRRPDFKTELHELLVFKSDKYFPRSLESLLSKWQATLDRYRTSGATKAKQTHAPTKQQVLDFAADKAGSKPEVQAFALDWHRFWSAKGFMKQGKPMDWQSELAIQLANRRFD